MKKSAASQKALNLWAVILIIWSVYRFNFKIPEWFDEFIAKPIVFILPVYYYIVRVEKRNFFSALNWRLTTSIKDYLLGLVLGGIFVVAAVLSSFFKYGRAIINQGKPLILETVLLTVAIALATAVSEEILSRGFIFNRLFEESKNLFSAALYSSFLFFFLHVPMLFTSSLRGNIIFVVMIMDMILSMVNALLLIGRKNLTIPIIVHALYSLTFYFFN